MPQNDSDVIPVSEQAIRRLAFACLGNLAHSCIESKPWFQWLPCVHMFVLKQLRLRAERLLKENVSFEEDRK